MRRIEGTINHWSVTGPTTTVDDIRKMHKAKGWRDIGYHRVILHPDSREFKKAPRHWWELVKLGRHLDNDLYIEANEIGAQALGYNKRTIGVCVVGRPGLKLHPLQKEAIIQTNKIFADRFKYSLATGCKGHRDVNATECPGNEIYDVVVRLRKGEL